MYFKFIKNFRKCEIKQGTRKWLNFARKHQRKISGYRNLPFKGIYIGHLHGGKKDS